MSEPTVIIAVLSVIGHCLAIFWPRKPLQERIDANGMPVLWCNNDEKQQDIACIWRDAAEEPAIVTEEAGRQRQSA
jgi:hypothetical protein